MISSWPVYREDWNCASEEKDIEIIKEAVRGIRNVRSSMNVPQQKSKGICGERQEDIKNAFTQGRLFFASLAYASEVTVPGRPFRYC